EPYAQDLAARLGDLQGGDLLEIAAGTGAVTAVLDKSLPTAVRLVATDLNEAMLRVGASRTNSDRVKWRQADAQELPFEAASFDAVVCQFGVMFLPDKRVGYREALRVLRPGGRYLFSVWNRVTENEVTDVGAGAVAALFPDNPPQFLERTPFGYHDVAVIRQELESAGFQRIEIDTVELVSISPSAEYAAVGLCQGTPLRNEIETRNPAALDEATAAATRALTARFGSGPFDNRMSAHVVTAFRT
ncbi:MAG TPA: methyltransferase domain-containing protein, partial [Polyangiaceae bacterium]|nr:methyltransferase domain-containing protein [Polyangiaceae bacterium]